jgi:hypothetical protein
VELPEILSCPHCGGFWDALPGCSDCSLSPDDFL